MYSQTCQQPVDCSLGFLVLSLGFGADSEINVTEMPTLDDPDRLQIGQAHLIRVRPFQPLTSIGMGQVQLPYIQFLNLTAQELPVAAKGNADPPGGREDAYPILRAHLFRHKLFQGRNGPAKELR